MDVSLLIHLSDKLESVEIVTLILDLLRYIVPALVVYLLMRQFIKGQMATEQMKVRAALSGDNKALRIQAYERLTLLCERINIMSLLMRLNTGEMDIEHLKNAMLITIQKEYEHNLTQQIYVSGQLWEMVTLLKDSTIATITSAYMSDGQGEKATFTDHLMQQGAQLNNTMSKKVGAAIRKEVELYFQ